MTTFSAGVANGEHRGPIRVGLIGCGNIWRSVYRPIVAKLEGRVTITALCDLSAAAAEQAAAALPGVRCHSNPESLCREERLDAVMVLTSEQANASTALTALRAGLAVYLEKPPAISVDEWRQLNDAAEVEMLHGQGRIYTAFNRRHTPLFERWRFPEEIQLRSVRGVLHRQGRGVRGFPCTAVHLIDSVQFFSGQQLAETRSIFDERENGSFWQVAGVMGCGADCHLSFVPNGPDNAEYLVFAAENQVWELHFPNGCHTRHPGGLLVSPTGTPRPEHDAGRAGVWSEPGADPLEAMGHAACFRDFLSRTEDGAWETCPHQLRRCQPTIALLEEMLSQAEASLH